MVMAGGIRPDDFAFRGDTGIGSNNWVATGSMTANGTPLLANDPHLGIQMPSIWYEIGLHCLPVTDQCPLNVVGFALSPAPGVIIGHNDQHRLGRDQRRRRRARPLPDYGQSRITRFSTSGTANGAT